MFSFIDNLIKLVIGIPIMIVLVYFLGALCQAFFGGPIWLWIAGILIIGVLAVIEEFNKSSRSAAD